MAKVWFAVVLVVMAGCWRDGAAQRVDAALPVYDVVVIKINHGVSGRVTSEVDDAVFLAINVTLKHLLVNAYGVREGLLSGLPGWADSVKFDVTAKVTDPDIAALRRLSHEQRQKMLAQVLENRFHLKTHIEQKTLPVYNMVVAKGGPKLALAKVAPDATDRASPEYGRFNVHNSEMSATGASMAELAGNLSYPLDRTVIDKTGLTGRYDFQLQWTPDSAADGGAADAPPNLFTAMETELGLKLEPGKGPVDTLVIDHVEQPTEN